MDSKSYLPCAVFAFWYVIVDSQRQIKAVRALETIAYLRNICAALPSWVVVNLRPPLVKRVFSFQRRPAYWVLALTAIPWGKNVSSNGDDIRSCCLYKVISIQLFTAVISVILKPGSTKVSQTSIR